MNLQEALFEIQADPKLKEKFLKDPKSVLAEAGLDIKSLSIANSPSPTGNNPKVLGCHKVGHDWVGCITVG
jgi:hypothetical protein